MAISICLFNHKGGVSKTTTTFNLGWCLADMGKKVLIVDLDSQCNLTGLVFSFDATKDENMTVFYSNQDNLTMRPIVSALINGVSPDEFIRSEGYGKLYQTENRNLFLLPGHLDVSDLDAQISVSLKIASGIPGVKNIPGNLPSIIKKIVDKNKFEYVLYDLSPNVGGLNEVALMSSDYFIIPTSPDYFCLQAVGSLEKNISKWKEEIDRFRIENGFGSDFPIKNAPLFLGAIHQRYRPRNEKPAKSFEKWISLIRDALNRDFIPSMEKIGCVAARGKVTAALAGSELSPYDLAQVSDFNSLIAISQQLSKPIFALSDSEIEEQGKVFGHAFKTMQESRNNFEKIFADLGKRIIQLTT